MQIAQIPMIKLPIVVVAARGSRSHFMEYGFADKTLRQTELSLLKNRNILAGAFTYRATKDGLLNRWSPPGI
jgi:hypothetical protein